jgi:hypothetical protein
MYCKNILLNECTEKDKINKKSGICHQTFEKIQIRRLEGFIRMSPPSLNLLGRFYGLLFTAVCYTVARNKLFDISRSSYLHSFLQQDLFAEPSILCCVYIRLQGKNRTHLAFHLLKLKI